MPVPRENQPMSRLAENGLIEELDLEAVVGWSVDVYRDHLEMIVPFAVFAVFALIFEASLELVDALLDVGPNLSVTVDPELPAEVLRIELTDGMVAAFVAGAIGNAVLLVLAGLTAVGTAFLVAGDVAAGSERTLERRLWLATTRLPALLVAALLATVLVVIGLFLLIVPGLYLAGRLSLAGPAIVIGRRGPVAGLRTSWALTEGGTVQTLGIVVLGVLAVAVVAAIPFVGPVISTLVVLPLFALALGYLYVGAGGDASVETRRGSNGPSEV